MFLKLGFGVVMLFSDIIINGRLCWCPPNPLTHGTPLFIRNFKKYSVDILTLSSDTANDTYQIKFEKLWCRLYQPVLYGGVDDKVI